MGELTPAALIPFCAYQTNLTVLGQDRQDLPFTVCDKFKPTVLKGQLCYQLDITKITTNGPEFGKNKGLLLILDPGISEEKLNKLHFDFTGKIETLNLEPRSQTRTSPKIYINTLSTFTDYRAGSYAMSALKSMKGTENFLKLPDDDKGCQIMTFEDCEVKSYVEEVQKQCGCLPWAMDYALKNLKTEQVNMEIILILRLLCTLKPK